MSAFRRMFDWCDERFGLTEARVALLDRKIPIGVGWWYVLGSATAFTFVILVVTGALIGMQYVPSPDHAYDSVRYITDAVPWGWFIRGLHKWSASAMMVLLLLHALRVFFMGSYKYPREITWVTGVLLLLAAMGSGFTGYLLPWDQKAYWATSVGINIASQVPWVGPFIGAILRGGDTVGALTLSRFYAFHVLVLPIVIALLAGVHLFLVVKHGISAPPGLMAADGAAAPQEPKAP